MSDNPFDQLGLKKEIVSHLVGRGQLDDFLRGYVRLVQSKIHPDLVQGNGDLSSLINSTYASIKEHPERVLDWASSMQNGSSGEHLVVIEALAAEVERLQKVDKENEELRKKYAEVLAKGYDFKVPVRDVPKIRTGRDSYPFDDIDADDFGVRYDGSFAPEEPKVRTPPRAKRREPEPRREEPAPRTRAELIVLSDIVLYDSGGAPARRYGKITLDGEAAKDGTGEYLLKTQDEWIAYWNHKRRILPSLPLWYAMLEKLHEEKHPGLAGVVEGMKESWLATSTRPNYARNVVTHDYGFASAYTVSCVIPVVDAWFKDVVKKKDWRPALQALLLCKDVEKAAAVLQDSMGVPPYIWAAFSETRVSHPERAVRLGADAVRLYIDCYFIIGDGRSRSVACG